jgi:hypothetical protein
MPTNEGPTALPSTVTLSHYCHIFWFARAWALIIDSSTAIEKIPTNFWRTVTVSAAPLCHSMLMMLMSRHKVLFTL